jgi:PAS domain S-box-containing protein
MASDLRSSQDGHCTFDGSGEILTADAVLCAMFGYDLDSLTSNGITALVPELGPEMSFADSSKEDSAYGVQKPGKIILGSSEFQESIGRRKDSTEFPIQVAFNCARLSGSAFYSGIFREISSSGYKTKAVSNVSAEDRVKSILNTVAEGIICIRHDGSVELVNQAALQFFGYKEEELLNRNVSVLMEEPFCREHDGYLSRYHQTGEARVIGVGRELFGKRKDGSLFPMELTVSATMVANELFFTGSLRDITQRKELQTKLLGARDEALRANRAKDTVLATCSHEIHTQLLGLTGMLESLELTTLTDEQSSLVDGAMHSSAALLRIVNDILDWSKLYERGVQIVPTKSNLAKTIFEVLQCFKFQAKECGVSLSFQMDEKLSIYYLVDSMRLLQILLNLVGNAVKFTPVGGAITLHVVRVDDDSSTSEHRLQFSVQDTGVGMSEETLGKIFMPFMQAAGDTAHHHGGTGLGLSICNELAQLMGAGKIQVESSLGNGSTFTFVLPLPVVHNADEETDKDGARHNDTKKKKNEKMKMFDATLVAPKILAVEDNRINRMLLERQLQHLGLRYQIESSGSAALQVYTRDRDNFDAVLTDCHMPDMSGNELCASIRAIENEQHLERIPIVGWTGTSFGYEHVHSYEAGMDEILVKPTSVTVLRTCLEKYLKPKTETEKDEEMETLTPV